MMVSTMIDDLIRVRAQGSADPRVLSEVVNVLLGPLCDVECHALSPRLSRGVAADKASPCDTFVGLDGTRFTLDPQTRSWNAVSTTLP